MGLTCGRAVTTVYAEWALVRSDEGRGSVLSWVRRALWDVVPRDHREPSATLRRRQLTIVLVAAVGAVVLGFSLRADPGSIAFYWWTLALAGVWVVGAIAAGPLHLGRIRYRSGYARPVLTPILVGVVLVALFVAGGLVVREIPVLEAQVRHVLVFADQGVLPLVVLVTVVNGIAEELFFRGALYAAVPRHSVAVATIANAVVVLAAGNLMLTFAAVLLAVVVGLERRASGGILGPILTHVTWSGSMLFVLPVLFG